MYKRLKLFVKQHQVHKTKWYRIKHFVECQYINIYLHHPMQYIKHCRVRLLSNYNIKYICTIYTHLDTCLMSIARFSLRDNVTLRLLKLYFYIVDVVEWSRALDIMLSEWCCSVSMVWVQIRRGKNKHLTAQGSNSNPVWFNFQTYI